MAIFQPNADWKRDDRARTADGIVKLLATPSSSRVNVVGITEGKEKDEMDDDSSTRTRGTRIKTRRRTTRRRTTTRRTRSRRRRTTTLDRAMAVEKGV